MAVVAGTVVAVFSGVADLPLLEHAANNPASTIRTTSRRTAGTLTTKPDEALCAQRDEAQLVGNPR